MPYTEQQIRGLAINFLRFHYKLRPRLPGSETRVVDRPHDFRGTTIDARLAFERPDGGLFTATVEASSMDRSHEVTYQRDYRRLLRHATLTGLVVWTLIIWAGTRVPGLQLWKQYGHTLPYLLVIGGLLATIALFAMLLMGRKNYRRIPAVEQFKRFHAEAQWVAYDVAIFRGTKGEAAYRELERQCIRYGFGMLAVEAESVVRNVINPSEVDQFQGLRHRLSDWLARAELPALPRPRVEVRSDWFSALLLLLLIAGMVVQATYRPVVREGRRYAAPGLGGMEAENNPAPVLPPPNEGVFDRLPIEDDEEEAPPPERLHLSANGTLRLDGDCVGLDRLGQPLYLVLYGHYPDFHTAQDWAEEVNRLYRLPVTVAAGDCVAAGADGYFLYLDPPLENEGAANLAVRNYSQLLGKNLDVYVVE